MPYVGHQYFAEAGHGRPLVLVHGHTLDHRIWAEALPALAARCRVIMPDMAGHGRSGPPPEGTTLAGDLADLLRALGIERAAVLGLSLGGAAAISFALHYPQMCAALIPVDAALFGHRFSEWPSTKPYIAIAKAQGLQPALAAWLADPLFAPAMASPAADAVRTIVREYPGCSWLGATPAPFPPGRPEAERLGEIQAPTLVLLGEHDLPDFQRIAERLATEIPGAHRRVIPGSGHLLPVEQPAAFAAAVLAFLDDIPGR